MMRFGLALLLVITTNQPAYAASGDEAGVRAAVSVYLQGQATGDAEHYRKVFHPDARLHGVRDGKPEQRTLAEYLALQSGKPAADEADRKRTVTNVVVTGDAAVATIILDYPRALTTDYMSLIRSGDTWTIVHKLYNVQSKPTR